MEDVDNREEEKQFWEIMNLVATIVSLYVVLLINGFYSFYKG